MSKSIPPCGGSLGCTLRTAAQSPKCLRRTSVEHEGIISQPLGFYNPPTKSQPVGFRLSASMAKSCCGRLRRRAIAVRMDSARSCPAAGRS